MKKLLTLILASVMLFSCFPAAFASEEEVAPALVDASPFTINEETGYIENIPDFITARELRNHFCNPDKIIITDAKGNALKLDDTVGTNASVTIGNKSVKALVHGDVDGDAKINIKDALAIVKSMAGVEVDMVADAADVTYDGKSNVKDAMAILKLIAGWDVDLTNRAIYGGDVAEYEDSSVSMYFDSVMNRISETNLVGSGDLTYTIRTAKNEIEDVQILLASTEEKVGLTLEVGDIVNQNGVVLPMEVRYGYYYDIGEVWLCEGSRFVDPYIKLEGAFDLPANLSRCFLIKVKTPADAEAGLYKTTVNLKDSEGKIIKTGTVRVYVWNFVLDDETACDTAFGMGGATNSAKYVYGYEYMLENRITAYGVPYGVMDPRGAAYLDNPRVTSVALHITGYESRFSHTDEEIVAAYNKLRQNPVWLEKAYLYPVDEPYNDDGFQALADFHDRMTELIPEDDFRIIVPLADNHYFAEKQTDSTAIIQDYVNMWCPQSYAFRPYMTYSEYIAQEELYPTPYEWYMWCNASSYRKYGDWIDRYESFRERGDTMWWYICCGPGVGYANFFQMYPGVVPRVLFWQQYMNNIQGLLYWTTTYYAIDGTDSKVSLHKTNGGDGLLLYEGALFSASEYYSPSIRFESVRDGIEDFQYLSQLDKLTSREDAMTFVTRITKTIVNYTKDYKVMMTVRDELGAYLESLYDAN